MKFRYDYVTNSSSSSFVIGKKDDDNITIESVYQTIKAFYKEYLSKIDAVVQYITDNPKLGIVYQETEDGKYYSFHFLKGGLFDDRNYEINKAIERDFGISMYDYVQKDHEWLECQTYKDYEKYWLEKMSITDSYNVHAPFTIADFLEEKEINWLHYDGDKEIHHVNSESDILDWYFEYAEKELDNQSCDTCSWASWCDKEECKEERKMVKNTPEDKMCLYLLGRICVYSECGYIADYVVDKLSEISEYSCNHMG